MKLHLPKSLLAFALTCAGAACLTLPAAYAESIAQNGDSIVKNDGATHEYDSIQLRNTTLSITDGTTVKTGTFVGCDPDNGAITVNIGSADATEGAAKSSLIGTSMDADDDTNHWKGGSTFRLSHYPTQATYNIYSDGELRVKDAVIDSSGDGSSVVNVNGGEMNVRGYAVHGSNKSTITVTNGGKLNFGKDGIITYNNAVGSITVTDSHLGGLDSWSTTAGNNTGVQNITMGNSTIHTNSYVFDEETQDWAGYTGEAIDIALTGKLITTAANTLDGSGSLTISNTLDHALNLADGATATLKLSSLDNFDYYLANGTTHGRSSDYLIMKGASNIDSVMVGTTSYDLVNSGDVMLVAAGNTVYTVHSGTAVYDATTSVSPSDFSGVSQIILSGGVLDMKTGLTDVEDGILVSHTASDAAPVISLAKSVVLDNADLNVASGSSVQLAGSGTYVLGSTVNIPTGISVLTENLADGSAEKWTGTVQVGTGTSYTTIAGQRFDTLCTTDSVIELKGLRGYLQISGSSATSAPHTANFKLTDSGDIKALVINNGSNTQYYNFSGNISGDGSIVRDGSANWTRECHFHFSGDVSDWDGEFLNSLNATTKLHFTGNAQAIGADINNTGTSTMYVEIDNADDVTVTGDIKGKTEVTYKQSGNKVIASEASDYEGNTTISEGKVTLASSKALGDSAQTNVNSGATLAVQAGVTEINLGGDTKAITVKNDATLQVAEGVALTGALTLEGGSTLDLTGFDFSTQTFSGDTTVLTTTGNMTVGNITVEGVDGTAGLKVAENTISVVTSPDLVLTDVVTYANNTLTFSLTTDVTHLIGDVVISLGDMTAPELGELVYAAKGDFEGEVSLSFTNSNGELIYLGNVTSLSINGYSGEEGWAVSTDGLSVGAYKTAMIPEPTTATLSLLALAGLAARRRRK